MIFTLLTLLFFLAVAGGLAAAYMSGALNPLIEQLGMYFFKAKAKAEEKKLEAQGLKEGQDFMASELKGNQQASEVAHGVGNMGGIAGLKKDL